ncbi:MAG: biopolymer transporter ExbD [Prolixibacteraceae bacterium]|jgi:biopolymer transport protein ExbD|nr:biopolymer transporter ExbD [Prolixibacteraceae bacterium]MDI9564466.1 biopolymer transporter ExbD [Bacteroidota bacterium]NLT00786.1 biopolymer transporter ExbD [Bacteroidales bacterium]HNZ68367.1 biopolymer transporter ExbD [Prolixibacteraceae bacterium]HOC86217.1 biopolymer transporter ExbD [Prolixibacteraceae bacterium]
MALKKRNKISASFSMASMTDVIFLLLIFFMLSSTLVAPNALKLLLPQSNNQTAAKPVTTVSITKELQYYINDEGALKRVAFQEIEPFLVQKFGGQPEPYISLHADRSVPFEEVVKIMNIARKNDFKLIVATAKED